jgi:hypothetical protein
LQSGTRTTERAGVAVVDEIFSAKVVARRVDHRIRQNLNNSLDFMHENPGSFFVFRPSRLRARNRHDFNYSGESGLSAHLRMGPPQVSTEEINTTVTLNNQGLIDLLQAAVTGLQPKANYQLALVQDREDPYRDWGRDCQYDWPSASRGRRTPGQERAPLSSDRAGGWDQATETRADSIGIRVWERQTGSGFACA